MIWRGDDDRIDAVLLQQFVIINVTFGIRRVGLRPPVPITAYDKRSFAP